MASKEGVLVMIPAIFDLPLNFERAIGEGAARRYDTYVYLGTYIETLSVRDIFLEA